MENPLAEGLMDERRAEPFTAVIFGASGDLTARKLIPALFNLSCDGHLPPRFAVLGVARREKSDDDFRREMAAGLGAHSRTKADGEAGEGANFIRRLFYHRLDLDDGAAYAGLARRLAEIERAQGLPPNRLFYLATLPTQFAPILESLSASGRVRPAGRGPGWQRAVIEKPFGRDLASARALNAVVAATLDESQAFRIDHYLGKETVQNILTFRFANAILEPLWDRRHIASVQIAPAWSRTTSCSSCASSPWSRRADWRPTPFAARRSRSCGR
jgi:glucose-6-phosphate 1-dehydrogenase